MEEKDKASSPDKEKDRENYIKIIKIIVLSILLVTAHIIFGLFLKRALEQYEFLFFPNLDFIILITLLFVAMFFIALFSGVFSALVRPFWIGIMVFLISTILTIIFFNISWFSIIFGLIYFGLSLIYLRFVEHELKIRISFSVNPIWQGQKILLAGLIILISFAFAYGYYDNAKQNNFVIPPQYEEMILDGLTNIGGGIGLGIDNPMQGMLENQIPSQLEGFEEDQSLNDDEIKQKQEDQIMESLNILNPLAGIEEGIKESWQNLEEGLKPFLGIVAFSLGILIFLSIESVVFFVAWIVPIALLGIFPLLKKLKIVKVTTKMEEVKRLVL